MSRRRVKSLKSDQVIDLLLNDTPSSSNEDSDDELPIKSHVKIVTDDDAKLPDAKKPKIELEENHSQSTSSKSDSENSESTEDSDNDVPLSELIKKRQSLISSESDDDMPFSALIKKELHLKLEDSNNIRLQNEQTMKQEMSSKMFSRRVKEKCNKKIASLLKGVYDFLESETYNAGTGFDSGASSDAEYSESECKENCGVGNSQVKKKFKEFVAESPVIKMENCKENRYFMSVKNLKRKIF